MALKVPVTQGQEEGFMLALVAVYMQDQAEDYTQGQEEGFMQDQAGGCMQGPEAVYMQGPEAVYMQDQAVVFILVHLLMMAIKDLGDLVLLVLKTTSGCDRIALNDAAAFLE